MLIIVIVVAVMENLDDIDDSIERKRKVGDLKSVVIEGKRERKVSKYTNDVLSENETKKVNK